MYNGHLLTIPAYVHFSYFFSFDWVDSKPLWFFKFLVLLNILIFLDSSCSICLGDELAICQEIKQLFKCWYIPRFDWWHVFDFHSICSQKPMRIYHTVSMEVPQHFCNLAVVCHWWSVLPIPVPPHWCIWSAKSILPFGPLFSFPLIL